MSADESADFRSAPKTGSPPPPLPGSAGEKVWHVSARGKTVGPTTAERVRNGVESGKIPLHSLIWKEGMADWLPLAQVSEFAHVSPRPAPPPLSVPVAAPEAHRALALDAGRTMQHAAPLAQAVRKTDALDHGSTMQHRAEPAKPLAPAPFTLPVNELQGTEFPIGHVLDERLVITLKLGQGGMGAVYRVTDRETHVDYAVKVLASALVGSPQALADLRKEVARAQPLTHQNLVNIKYFADRGPVKYIVMENIEGEDLESYRLRKGGKISPDDFAKFVPQILAGMEFLHERGVVHLDIKPQNILVSRSGEVKIADYGISRTIKEQLAQRDQSQVTAGTLCFMSPEQLRPGTVCDRRADIYALGMTFHLLLTGGFPFPLEDRQKIVEWHINEQHRLADLGRPKLNNLIGRSLAGRPENRWSTCQEMLNDFQQTVAPQQSNSLSQPGLDGQQQMHAALLRLQQQRSAIDPVNWYKIRFKWLFDMPQGPFLLVSLGIWLFYGFLWIPAWFAVDYFMGGPAFVDQQLAIIERQRSGQG